MGWQQGKGTTRAITNIRKIQKPTFVETFVGAANVSLNFDCEKYIWNDLNRDLILSYQSMAPESVSEYIKLCEIFFQCLGQKDYNNIRARFNNKTDTILIRTALFMYMNKYGFNGLCRYNSKGEFNVPYGKSDKFKSVPVDAINSVTKLIGDVSLHSGSFENIFAFAHVDMLIYSDPPYVPLTTDFNYTADGFGKEQHELLKKLSKESKCTAIISNHWTPYTEELYYDADEIHVFDVQRTISCDGGGRKKVQECIVVYKGEE